MNHLVSLVKSGCENWNLLRTGKLTLAGPRLFHSGEKAEMTVNACGGARARRISPHNGRVIELPCDVESRVKRCGCYPDPVATLPSDKTGHRLARLPKKAIPGGGSWPRERPEFSRS